MKYDIIITGVGGQGVLSIAAVIAAAALADHLHVKQSEVHGMAQRGGSVFAHLRLSSEPVASDLVALGNAAMVLSLEPLESLRYLDYLMPSGRLVTSVNPVANMTTYPKMEILFEMFHRLPNAVLVDAEELARRERNLKGVNMVMIGAASPWLPLDAATLVKCIERRFAGKGRDIVESNLRLFGAGREAAHAGQPVERR